MHFLRIFANLVKIYVCDNATDALYMFKTTQNTCLLYLYIIILEYFRSFNFTFINVIFEFTLFKYIFIIIF